MCDDQLYVSRWQEFANLLGLRSSILDSESFIQNASQETLVVLHLPGTEKGIVPLSKWDRPLAEQLEKQGYFYATIGPPDEREVTLLQVTIEMLSDWNGKPVRLKLVD